MSLVSNFYSYFPRPISKEAQKCLCGAASCRGFLGGENRVSVRAAAGKMKKERPRKKDTVSALTTVIVHLLPSGRPCPYSALVLTSGAQLAQV